jgi:hypothetical protein
MRPMSTLVALETIINAGNLVVCFLLWRELARTRRARLRRPQQASYGRARVLVTRGPG